MQIKLDELFYEQDDVQLKPQLPPQSIEIHGVMYSMTEDAIQTELNFHKSNEEEVLLQGKLSFAWQLLCDRCMAETKQAMNLDFYREIILKEDGHVLDLDELIREEAILNFPPKILCKEDCLGICPDCGNNRNEKPCECQSENATDIRLVGLKELFENNFKEV